MQVFWGIQDWKRFLYNFLDETHQFFYCLLVLWGFIDDRRMFDDVDDAFDALLEVVIVVDIDWFTDVGGYVGTNSS